MEGLCLLPLHPFRVDAEGKKNFEPQTPKSPEPKREQGFGLSGAGGGGGGGGGGSDPVFAP